MRVVTSAGTNRLWQPYSTANALAVDPGVVFDHGEGVWLYDVAGKRYLDGVGALEAMAIGHGRQRLADVASEQMAKLAFLDVFRYTSQPAIDLAEELTAIAPPNLGHVHFTPGGSEAVEVAIKLAIQYHWVRGETNRRHVICRDGSYHGTTFGAMNCDGRYWATRNDIYLGDTRFGLVASGPATGADWGPGGVHASGAAEFAAEVERVGAENVAAIIVDPLATASGVACAPQSDLVALRKLCDDTGILLIVDEVIAGFCRSGSMFTSERYGVDPDFMPVSKALSSGYQPIGATLIGDRVVEEIDAAGERGDAVFAHGHTYGGHPVACAVALENIRILREERLDERAALTGAYLQRALTRLERHETVLDVRGIGMLCGVEIGGAEFNWGAHADPITAATRLRLILRDLGLITLAVHPGTTFLLAPPLIMTETEVDQLVDIFDNGLTELEAAR